MYIVIFFIVIHLILRRHLLYSSSSLFVIIFIRDLSFDNTQTTVSFGSHVYKTRWIKGIAIGMVKPNTGFLTWIRHSLMITNDHIFRHSGLDALGKLSNDILQRYMSHTGTTWYNTNFDYFCLLF